MSNLKALYLDHIGYVVRSGQSAAEAFDALRANNPDAFPMPRNNKSFWDAIRDCIQESK